MTIDAMKRRLKALEGKSKKPYKTAFVTSQEQYDQIRASYPGHNLLIVTWKKVNIIKRD
jgi:hypothetical protein